MQKRYDEPLKQSAPSLAQTCAVRGTGRGLPGKDSGRACVRGTPARDKLECHIPVTRLGSYCVLVCRSVAQLQGAAGWTAFEIALRRSRSLDMYRQSMPLPMPQQCGSMSLSSRFPSGNVLTRQVRCMERSCIAVQKCCCGERAHLIGHGHAWPPVGLKSARTAEHSSSRGWAPRFLNICDMPVGLCACECMKALHRACRLRHMFKISLDYSSTPHLD